MKNSVFLKVAILVLIVGPTVQWMYAENRLQTAQSYGHQIKGF